MILDERAPVGAAGANFLIGGGNMGALIRAFDWASTPLGPPDRWPTSLRTAVRILLDSSFAMAITWGPEYRLLYNDGYRPVLGSTKHPHALGRPSCEVFAEVWDDFSYLFKTVYAGETVSLNDQCVPLSRNGYLEECFFTVSYSPLREGDKIGGLLAVVVETTERVQNERQLTLLRELADRSADATTFETACEGIAECLEAQPVDTPFAMIYRVEPDQGHATLAVTAGISRGHALVHESIDLQADAPLWPYEEALRTGAPVLVSLDAPKYRDVPAVDKHVLKEAVVVAVRTTGNANPAALLILGLHPLRHFDDHFRRFVELITAQFSAALTKAHSLTEQSIADATLRDEAHLLETLNRVGKAVAAELDLTRVVQVVTDAATELTGASFGSFFYNVTDAGGDSYWLYSLSGVPREAFANFPMPRSTPVFGPTFKGEGIVRSDDILQDPRYGKMEPHRGMPKGHLPVRSYLAVSVTSRSGEVIGGLFFGHRDVGKFTERSERLVAGIAQQAAIAIDNARLYEAAKMMESRQAALFEAERVARAGAEQAARIKDEFLATVSHELRTPLNAIVGWINVLQSSNARPSDVQRAVEVIKRNAQAQAQLIEDLLDMSRIMSGRMRLDVQPVTISAVIESAITSVLPAATAKDIRIQRVLDPLAGPISGDPGRLQQVMWNLLNNAIKFTPRGGRVQVTLERVNSHLEMSVSDSGVGIEPEFLAHVFDRFRQADASAARTYTGLGLGLAISKELVELHGGTIRVKSPGKDQGAVFIVALPLAPVAHQGLEREESREHPGAPSREAREEVPRLSLGGITVLAVEDEPDALELIIRVLTDAGAQVEGCGSAADALAIMLGRRFDIIVSDLGMAAMDGYEFVRSVRALAAEQGGATPAIALSAFARSEDRQRAYRAGFQMHVAKPVDPAELITIINALAGGPRARQE